MSGNITVRLWNDNELQAVANGKDEWLLTLLANNGSYLQREIKALYSSPIALKTYRARWYGEDREPEEVTLRAPNDEMVKRFCYRQYSELPLMLEEVYTEYREVYLTYTF